ATEAPAATEAPVETAAAANGEIILATTTSTQDSGLLDVLIPDFTAKTGIQVKTVAVGTGQALKMGEEGNADVLLVHAPSSEVTFMDNGFGKERLLVMHNDFIIVGPASDPAGIKGMTSAVDALKKIAEAKAPFITRGDDSGTNKLELSLWKKAEITPAGDWYINTGQGMGASLKVASEKEAYTITDRATYLANKDTLSLDVLLEKDPVLLNIYHVITVNPEKWPKVNVEGAKAFADYMVSPETQELIAKFGVDKYGQALFIADAGKAEDEVGK
ncbi:MAG: substrate-binding domain-containing protein, partial [Anaerolineaceae bacterium]